MAKPKETVTSIRFRPEDRVVIRKLERILGLNTTGIVRMAIRELARAQGSPKSAESEKQA
jgi:hypothetical protein